MKYEPQLAIHNRSQADRLHLKMARLNKSEARPPLTVARLQRNDGYSRAITQSTSGSVIIADRRGTMAYANPSVKRQFGYEPDELIGKGGFDFIGLADISKAIYGFGWTILTRDAIIPIAFTVKHKDHKNCVLKGVGTNGRCTGRTWRREQMSGHGS